MTHGWTPSRIRFFSRGSHTVTAVQGHFASAVWPLAASRGSLLAAYILRRIVYMLPTILGVVTLVFFIMRVVPGDVARNIAGIDATAEEVQEIRERLNLDRPVWEQYSLYLSGLARGDLGKSVYSPYSVSQELRWKLPATLTLALTSLALAIIVGITLGVLAAARPQSLVDYTAMGYAALSLALPNFVLALVLIHVFAERLRLLPATGAMDLKHLVLPVTVLALRESAVLLRMTRATMLDVLHSDYIRTARAKGLNARVVLLRHALRNALAPIVTIIGVQLGFALAGTVVIETVFGYPGVGNLIVQSLNQRDYTIVQGGVLLIATMFVIVNLLVDLSYTLIDPRISYAGR